MNPCLRLRNVPARLAAFIVVMIVVAPPLWAGGRPLEIQTEGPYVWGIIDDPDPTGRLRRGIPATDNARMILYVQGEDAASPSTLYTSLTPRPIAAWARESASGFDIVVSRYERGVWMTPEIVAGSPADELDPHLTQDPSDGSVHLVYWIDGESPVVVHQWAPADLSGWSAPELVSAPGEIALRPSACFHDGVLHVAYESHGPAEGGLPRLIVQATRVGLGFTSDVVAATYHAAPSWPQVHSRRGRMWVDWIDDSGEMAWRSARPDGGWEPVAREPFTTAEDRSLARGRIGLRAVE